MATQSALPPDNDRGGSPNQNIYFQRFAVLGEAWSFFGIKCAHIYSDAQENNLGAKI
jgi:hypothetical protein